MSSTVEDFIEHHGIKGMQWGVRNENRKAYKSWKKEASSRETGAKVVNASVKSFNPVLKQINNSPKFKGKNLNKDKKLNREYSATIQAGFNRHMATHSIDQTGTSLKGGRAVVWQMKGQYLRPTEVKVVRHAENDDQTIIPQGVVPMSFKLIKDGNGFVIGIEPDTTASHSVISIEEFLEHHGIKGMQWGVRKKPERRSSGDYKTASALRKKHVSELTNRQLKTANERGNLESNFKRMNPGKVAKGRHAVQEVLAVAGLAAGGYALFNSPFGKALRNAGRKQVYKQLKLFH